MSTAPTSAPIEWAGPARYLPPPEPRRREDGALHYPGVSYATPLGYRPLLLDLWVPSSASPAPLVVWVHGGAFLLGDRRYLPETLRPNQLFDALLAAGLAVATVDYRLSLEARFPAQLHDLKAAVRYLRCYADDLGISTGSIGCVGESAGGHLAALLGLTGRRAELEGAVGVVGPSSAVQVVVDWYGVSNMATMPRTPMPPHVAATLPPEVTRPPEDILLDGVDAQTYADASPVNHTSADSPPFLLLHGTDDSVVPYSQSEELLAALTAAGASAELVPVTGADHIFAGYGDIDALVDRTVRFLTDALTAAP